MPGLTNEEGVVMSPEELDDKIANTDMNDPEEMIELLADVRAMTLAQVADTMKLGGFHPILQRIDWRIEAGMLDAKVITDSLPVDDPGLLGCPRSLLYVAAHLRLLALGHKSEMDDTYYVEVIDGIHRPHH